MVEKEAKNEFKDELPKVKKRNKSPKEIGGTVNLLGPCFV